MKLWNFFKSLDKQTERDVESTERDALRVSVSRRRLRVRRLVSFILLCAALVYAFSGVVRYVKSVNNLTESDAKAARILEDLRREQKTPLVDVDR